MFVDQETWDALPDDLKAIFEAAVANWSLQQFESMYVGDTDALKAFVDAGDEHITWSEADMIEVRNMAKASWVTWGDKSPGAKKIYESQISFMEKIGLL